MNKQPLTRDMALKQVEGGVFGCFVEFRLSQAETIKWRDKATGKALEAPMVRHTVETGSQSMVVSERVPDDFDVKGYKPQFQKGDKCFLIFTEMTTERGTVKLRGELHPIKG